MPRIQVTCIILSVVSLTSCSQQQPTLVEETHEEKYKEVSLTYSSATTDDANPEKESIDRLFDEFGEMLREKRGEDFDKYFDSTMFVRSMKQQGLLPARYSDEAKLASVTSNILAEKMGDEITGIQWDRCEIRCVRFVSDKEAVVYTRNWDDESIPSKVRWWLFKSGESWRVYDLEILEVSMRYSVMTGVGLKMSEEGDTSSKKLPVLIQAFTEATTTGNYEGALATFEELESAQFPPALESLRLMMIAGMRSEMTSEEDWEKSLDAASRALAVNSDLPIVHIIRAVCYNRLEKHNAAIEAAQEYANYLGKDSEYFLQIGNAEAGLGYRDQAIAAYEASLADDPLTGNSLLGLIQLDPPYDEEKMLEYYRGLAEPNDWFITFSNHFIDREDPRGLAAVIAIHKQVSPDDPSINDYESQLAKFEEADENVEAE